MENTSYEKYCAYYVFSINEEVNGDEFWAGNGAALWNFGAELARSYDLPVDSCGDFNAPRRYAIPCGKGFALHTLFKACKGWRDETPAIDYEITARALLYNYFSFLDHPQDADAETIEEQEPSEDAEPRTDAEPSEDAQPSEEQEQDAETETQAEPQTDAPSEEQEPDDDYRRTFNKVFGELVFNYCVENYEHTDEQENAIEAYTLDAQRLESYAARKSVVYMIEADDTFAPEDYLENAERVDALDDEAQEFYVDALDDYGLDPFGAIDAAEDFERLDSSEQTLCRTLIEDEHESAALAVERAKKDFWRLCNVRRGHMSADYIIGAAYIDNLGGLDTLDAKTIEQFFDFESYGADLRKYDSIVETPDGDVWIEH